MDQTVVEYLNEQRASFSEKELNDVDSLVLSTIVYFSFESGALGRIFPSEFIPLPVAICGISHEDLYGQIWLSRLGGDEFLEALLASPRFMELKIGFYANEVSDHFEKQFAAVTFMLPDDSAYIAFRGTDNTLNGWKEDFNLTFMEQTASQTRAASYLEDAAELGLSRIFVGGHSKGGNLAEYATLVCREQTYDKIERVFSHDGPGFAFVPSSRIGTQEYISKLRKTVPESSIFGMLMENRSCYRVVQASGVLFAQHAPTNWRVDNGDFITLDKISSDASIISSTLNSWSNMYDSKQRALFIDAVYDLLRTADAETWKEFAEDRHGNTLAIAGALTKLPSDMRSTLFSMLKDAAPIFGSETAGHLRNMMSGR